MTRWRRLKIQVRCRCSRVRAWVWRLFNEPRPLPSLDAECKTCKDMAWAADALRVDLAELRPGYAVRPVAKEHVTYLEGRTVEPRLEAHGHGWKWQPRDARWRAVQDALVHSVGFER